MRRGAALALLVGLAAALPMLREQGEPAPTAVRAPSPSAEPGEPQEGPFAGAPARVVARRAATAAGEVDVSRATGPQAEVAVTIDPRDPEVLLAGSNSVAPALQAYGSVDGGASWTSEPLPAPGERCGYGDPAVAIGPDGRQFFAFLAGPCDGPRTQISLALATRSSAADSWTSRLLGVPGENQFGDKEAIAIDTSASSAHLGRLYLTWSRRVSASFQEVVISWSDDGGATWAPGVKVSSVIYGLETFSSIATGADGTVYVAWLRDDGSVFLARSTEGGSRFGGPVRVGGAVELAFRNCGLFGNGLRAQPRRCVTPAPLVTVDRPRGRVYVTYSASNVGRREQNVWLASFDEALTPLLRKRRVNPPEGKVKGDQFLPASAVDESTGRVWVCWYDTTGSARRTRVRYTCSATSDGGSTWTPPVRAASVFSDETGPAAIGFGYGDYAGLAAAAGVAHPVWTDSRDLATLREEIYTRAIR